MKYETPNIPEILREVVQDLAENKQAANIDSISVSSGITTVFTDTNDLQDGQLVLIDNTEYRIKNVTNRSFDVDAELTTANSYQLKLTYLYGHLAEFRKKISHSDHEQWPYVWLMLDIPYNNDMQPPVHGTATLRIAIVNQSYKDIDAATRNADNIKKIIQPLSTQLKNALYSYPAKNYIYLKPGERINFEETKRYFYGSEDGTNLVGTVADASELRFKLKFRTNLKKC